MPVQNEHLTYVKRLIRVLINGLIHLRRTFMPKRIYLVQTSEDIGLTSLGDKISFFFEGATYRVVPVKLGAISTLFCHGPMLLYGPDIADAPIWQRVCRSVFNVDEKKYGMEAWSWFDARVYLDGQSNLSVARNNFKRFSMAASKEYQKVYLFGTGPSLEAALKKDWSDGIRVVCNTIVRDSELWHHLEPHVVTAGDALYHFGYTEFARQFRADLLDRLVESPETIFVYPDYFHSRVTLDFPIDPTRLIPIKTGIGRTVHDCIKEEFQLPALGNVLNKLLLPIGCALSKNVKLWGFDGRAPTDELFWANSKKHSYPELMDTLMAAHPAFFDEFVPKADPEQYVRSVHGDVLEHCFSVAEEAGYHFEMLHESWTPTLSRRKAAL